MVASNQATIGLAQQVAEGTPAATSSARFFLAGGGLSAKPQSGTVDETSASQVPNYAYRTQVDLGGEPQAFVRPEFIGYLAYGVLGGKSVTGVADPFKHTFVYADTLPWWTMWKSLGNGLFEKFVDCRIGRLLLESESTGLLKATFTTVTKGVQFQTAAEVGGAAAETGQPFLHADGKGALKVEAAAVTRMQRASIEINRNVTAEFGDDVVPADAPTGKAEITIMTRETITDFSTYNRMVYGSAAPSAGATPTRDVLELGGAPAGIDFKWTRQAVPERSLQVLVPRCVATDLGGYEPNPSGEPLRGEHTYKGYDPGSGTSPLTIVLSNAKPSYT